MMSNQLQEYTVTLTKGNSSWMVIIGEKSSDWKKYHGGKFQSTKQTRSKKEWDSEVWLCNFKASIDYQNKKERGNKFPWGNGVNFALGLGTLRCSVVLLGRKTQQQLDIYGRCQHYTQGLGVMALEVLTKLSLWEWISTVGRSIR